MESELKPGLKADISFWVAFAFTFGSMFWVVNGEWPPCQFKLCKGLVLMLGFRE